MSLNRGIKFILYVNWPYLTNCNKSLKIKIRSPVDWHFEWQPACAEHHRHGTRCPDVANIISVASFPARKLTNDYIRWFVARSRNENVITTEHNCCTRWNHERSYENDKRNVTLCCWNYNKTCGINNYSLLRRVTTQAELKHETSFLGLIRFDSYNPVSSQGFISPEHS